MTKDEALRLALEALEGVLDDSPKVLDASISGGLYEVVQCRDAITAIKAALEAKDEPVVGTKTWFEDGKVVTQNLYYSDVYITPAHQGAKDEPVAYVETKEVHGQMCSFIYRADSTSLLPDGSRLYTTPPQRKPLTDEEITLIIADCASSHQHTDIHFARAIEAAHGIKGEA
jgi:hypothetical protein